MNPVTEQTLLKEYEANKVAVSPELQASMMKAAKVLTDTRFMLTALKKLNTAMLDKYRAEMELIDKMAPTDQKTLLKVMHEQGRADTDKSRHLLSTVLTEFETQKGFKSYLAVNGHPRIIQMTGLLSSKDFQDSLGAGHMAKDYVTMAHGVYSHRIQWYCLGNSPLIDADLKKLFVEFQQGMAWLITFDRRPEHPRAVPGQTGSIDPTDFRTPETLHTFLLESADAMATCPLLAQYVRDKASALKGKSWLLVRKAVAARKLFPAKKTALDGWKSMDSKDLEKKLSDVLGKADLAVLETFLKSSNVLYPQADGSYAPTH